MPLGLGAAQGRGCSRNDCSAVVLANRRAVAFPDGSLHNMCGAPLLAVHVMFAGMLRLAREIVTYKVYRNVGCSLLNHILIKPECCRIGALTVKLQRQDTALRGTSRYVDTASSDQATTLDVAICMSLFGPNFDTP
jgi:hypothetical protein